MAERLPLDLTRLAVSTAPLRLALAISCVVGLAIGMAIIIACAFFTTLMLPLGFFPTLAAILATSSNMAQLTVVAVAAAIVIPLGAALAAYLRLRGVERFVLDDCGATAADPASRIGEVIAVMSRAAGLPEVPRYGLVENVFNAFAMSSSHSVGLVLLGKPLASSLKPAETLAILGHEIGHIAMRDSERKYLMMAHQEYLFSFLMIAGLKRWARTLFGFVGELALAAHSREREYWADAVGAHVTSPSAMISALQALRERHKPTKVEKQYAALMFRQVSWLFSTHPSMNKRIEALESRRYLDRLPLAAAPLPGPAAKQPAPTQRYSGI